MEAKKKKRERKGKERKSAPAPEGIHSNIQNGLIS